MQIAQNRAQDSLFLEGVFRHLFAVLEKQITKHDVAPAFRVMHQATDIQHGMHVLIKLGRSLRFEIDVIDAKVRFLIWHRHPARDFECHFRRGAWRVNGESLRICSGLRIKGQPMLAVAVEDQIHLGLRPVQHVADPGEGRELLRLLQFDRHRKWRIVLRLLKVNDERPSVDAEEAVDDVIVRMECRGSE